MRFKIVIPTQKTLKEYMDTDAYTTVLTTSEVSDKHEVNIVVVPENKTGLSEVYQNQLNAGDYDYVVCIHDDLEIHDAFFIDKLVAAHNQYDIVGLAGAASQDYSQGKPSVWHMSKINDRDGRGFVSHSIPANVFGEHPAHINSTFFGPTPSKVAIIDGLFMSFKMDKIREVGEVFDRDFTFHHYDLAMCVNALRKNLTLGVWPIYCLHHGLGHWQNDPTWAKMANIFISKYGNYKYITQ